MKREDSRDFGSQEAALFWLRTATASLEAAGWLVLNRRLGFRKGRWVAEWTARRLFVPCCGNGAVALEC